MHDEARRILLLSWNLAAETKLYKELSINPYSSRALRLILERFPNSNYIDVIRAVIFAEPEGRSSIIIDKTEDINKRLSKYCADNIKKLRIESRENVYKTLTKIIFETDDLKEIERLYTKEQRIHFKLSIVNFIESINNKKIVNTRQSVLFASLGLFLAASIYGYCFIQIKERTIASQASVESITSKTINHGQDFPTRLKIPSISVNAAVEEVGVTKNGEMGVPDDSSNVGWFSLGSRPGEKGSAVIAGHFSLSNGDNGVFFNLNSLKKGDKLYVEKGDGETIAFVVREVKIIDPGYAEDIFSLNDNSHLNLVTCDGVWNEAEKSYNKRLVVFTDISS